MSTSVRVLLVDDYEPFRSVVVSQLQEKPELVFIAEASDGFEAVQKVSPKSKISLRERMPSSGHRRSSVEYKWRRLRR